MLSKVSLTSEPGAKQQSGSHRNFQEKNQINRERRCCSEESIEHGTRNEPCAAEHQYLIQGLFCGKHRLYAE